MGRRRQSPLGFILSPARPGQFRPRGGHLEPGAASSPSQPTNGRPRALKPGAPSFRQDPADGRAWHSGARGPEVTVGRRSRQALEWESRGGATGWERGDLNLFFLRGASAPARGRRLQLGVLQPSEPALPLSLPQHRLPARGSGN